MSSGSPSKSDDELSCCNKSGSESGSSSAPSCNVKIIIQFIVWILTGLVSDRSWQACKWKKLVPVERSQTSLTIFFFHAEYRNVRDGFFEYNIWLFLPYFSDLVFFFDTKLCFPLIPIFYTGTLPPTTS